MDDIEHNKSVENLIAAHERNREDAFVIYLNHENRVDWAVKGERLPPMSVVLEVHAFDGQDWNAIVLHDSGMEITENAVVEAFEHFDCVDENPS